MRHFITPEKRNQSTLLKKHLKKYKEKSSTFPCSIDSKYTKEGIKNHCADEIYIIPPIKEDNTRILTLLETLNDFNSETENLRELSTNQRTFLFCLITLSRNITP